MAVNYNRVNFKNRVVQYPRSYTESTNSGGGITHTPSPGFVVQEGNLPTETNMNQMDKGIKDCADAINEMLQTLQSIQEILSRYNSRITSNENSITGIRTVDAQQSTDIESVTQAHSALAGNVATDEAAAQSHYADYTNPHRVTKAQIGLGNVPNVATNNQTPTYTEATADANLTSGETMATAFGKLQRAVRSLWAHIADEENPHNTTLFDVAEECLINEMGNPDTIGTFVGTGSGEQNTPVTVNGQTCYANYIHLGYTPSYVVILLPYSSSNTAAGMNEDDAHRMDVSILLTVKQLFGVAVIAPGLNYYHTGCGVDMRTHPPERVLNQNHGGAVVYGDGFIVQSYQHRDDDTIMYTNCKDRRYTYLAWR